MAPGSTDDERALAEVVDCRIEVCEGERLMLAPGFGFMKNEEGGAPD